MHFSPLKGLKRNKAGGGVGGAGKSTKEMERALSFHRWILPVSVLRTRVFSLFFRELNCTYFSGIFSSQTKSHQRLWPMSKFVAMICWLREKQKTKQPPLIKCPKEKHKKLRPMSRRRWEAKNSELRALDYGSQTHPTFSEAVLGHALIAPR